MSDETEEEIEEGEGEGDEDEGDVPPFVQIVAMASHAFGRADGEYAGVEALYGLDKEGRVWEWCLADPERKGSRDGWERLPSVMYRDGEEPPVQRKTR